MTTTQQMPIKTIISHRNKLTALLFKRITERNKFLPSPFGKTEPPTGKRFFIV